MSFFYSLDTVLFILAGLSTYFLQRINRYNSYNLVTDVISITVGDLLIYVYLGILFVVSPWYVPLGLFLLFQIFWILTPEFIGAFLAIPAKFFVNVVLCIVILVRLFTSIGDSPVEIKVLYIFVAIGIVAVGWGYSFLASLAAWKRNKSYNKEDLFSDFYNELNKLKENKERADKNKKDEEDNLPKEDFSQSGTFTDPRDGRTYKTVKIGEQVWMAENLNYAIEGSRRYGEGENELSVEEIQTNGEKYGRLYDWKMANNVVPPGWHLPSEEEWIILENFVGGYNVAGKRLKFKSGWVDEDGNSCNGTDNYGFAALPGGSGHPQDLIDVLGIDASFGGIGEYGNWWSSTDSDKVDSFAYFWFMNSSDNYLYGHEHSGDKSDFLSVRCVKD